MISISSTLIQYFYPEDTPLRRMLLKHSGQVRDKALAILRANPGLALNETLISEGAMLHDIGIRRCHAPDILCTGTEPYIAHGILGAEMLREYGREHRMDLEVFAGICERHTGSGLTAEMVEKQHLPIPVRDYLPQTPEEKLICLADKFFSKSGDMKEKSMDRIRRSMSKFGEDSLRRFNELAAMFGMKD